MTLQVVLPNYEQITNISREAYYPVLRTSLSVSFIVLGQTHRSHDVTPTFGEPEYAYSMGSDCTGYPTPFQAPPLLS